MQRLVLCCIVCLGLASSVRAEGDWVILGQGNAFWTGNLDMPVCKEMGRLQKHHAFRSVAFTPDGDWVVLLGGNGFVTNNGNLPVCKKMAELQKENADFKCVAFAPGGGWTLIWGQNGFWTEGSAPDEAFKKMQEVGKSGGTLRSISYAPNGGWVLLFDKTGVWSGGTPDDLGKAFDHAIKHGHSVRCVSFTGTGDWICVTSDGWSTSNKGLPVCKQLSELSSQHQQLEWVAVIPADPSAGPCWLASTPYRRVKAVLTTDIGHPNATLDDWYVYAPQVPDLPCQQDVKCTFSPKGRVIEEDSPLKRHLILTRITDGRKQLHAVLTIEATLVSRHLQALAPGQKAPKVPDLSPEEVATFTRASDKDAKPFRDWLSAAHLERGKDESDMALARRAFKYIKHHFTYQFGPTAHSASETCAAGKSDCGGLSAVFIVTMRANGIPARMLGGRWAASQLPPGPGVDSAQVHVKSEFFARGIGWVPADASGAVGDIGGPDFAFFGNDDGEFISFAEGDGFLVDSFVNGKQEVPIFQGLAWWCRLSGDDKGNTFNESWMVQKEKMR